MKKLISQNIPSRALSYIENADPAISGHGGHDQMFRVACALVTRFRLPLEATWALLLEYNGKCDPPFSKVELIHKICDACKLIGANYSEAVLAMQLAFSISDDVEIAEVAKAQTSSPERPDCSGFRPGTSDEVDRLAALRSIPVAGLKLAQENGVLVFGRWIGNPVFGVTDSSGRILELRKLDGKSFPAFRHLSERKAQAVKRSNKRWPVGIPNVAPETPIALVEGDPDLLAAFALVLIEQANASPETRCCPVAILSANPAIDVEALPMFKNKVVRIFPHSDANGTGYKGAEKWQKQILAAGATRCDFFDFSRLNRIGVDVGDLNEYLEVRNKTPRNVLRSLSIMPAAIHRSAPCVVTEITAMAAIRDGRASYKTSGGAK